MATPYPTGDRGPYANEQYASNQQLPYEPSNPSFSRAETSYSQSSGKKSRKWFTDQRQPREAKAVMETDLMRMLIEQSSKIEKRPYYNILAAACTWILLAGFIVLPGTYTNFQNLDLIKAANEDKSGDLGNKFLASIANIGLLAVAGVLCGVGLLGILGLWFKWRANYIWLINKLLLPALLNSLMGLLSTLVNVLSKPDKTFTFVAIVTTSVTGGLVLIWTLVFLYYNNYLLDAIRADHARVYGDQDAKAAINNQNGQPVV